MENEICEDLGDLVVRGAQTGLSERVRGFERGGVGRVIAGEGFEICGCVVLADGEDSVYPQSVRSDCNVQN